MGVAYVKQATLTGESGFLHVLQAIAGNTLDSSAPQKRGKEREVPKQKKPSSLKKVTRQTSIRGSFV